MVDFLIISIIALFKSPYMLFKGWHRLFHDCIGREGPFLETICVPFAGLAILLWPLAVVGAVLGSMVSSIFLGGYAIVVVYQVISPFLAYIHLYIYIHTQTHIYIEKERENRGYCAFGTLVQHFSDHRSRIARVGVGRWPACFAWLG